MLDCTLGLCGFVWFVCGWGAIVLLDMSFMFALIVCLVKLLLACGLFYLCGLLVINWCLWIWLF